MNEFLPSIQCVVLTQDVADSFVAGLEEDQEIFDQHAECQNRVLIPQIIVIELARVSFISMVAKTSLCRESSYLGFVGLP